MVPSRDTEKLRPVHIRSLGRKDSAERPKRRKPDSHLGCLRCYSRAKRSNSLNSEPESFVFWVFMHDLNDSKDLVWTRL